MRIDYIRQRFTAVALTLTVLFSSHWVFADGLAQSIQNSINDERPYARQLENREKLDDFVDQLKSVVEADPQNEDVWRTFAEYVEDGTHRESYADYIKKALKAYDRKDYPTALFYFKVADKLRPEYAETQYFIDKTEGLLNRANLLSRQRVDSFRQKKKSLATTIAQINAFNSSESPSQKPSPRSITSDKPTQRPLLKERPAVVSSKVKPKKVIASDSKIPAVKVQEQSRIIKKKYALNEKGRDEVVQDLDQRYWELQPNTGIDIELGTALVFRGNAIKRWLAINPDVLLLERLDNNTVRLIPMKRGSSIFHLWDEQGRWTFNIENILPIDNTKMTLQELEDLREEYVDAWKISYTNTWDGDYLGNSVKNLKRRNLSFRQWLGIYGGTPYGDFYASVNYYKFEESTERVGQRIGLTDAKIGPFKDFSIHGYDTEKRFSNLSLPNRSFRGILLDGYAFDRRVQYSYLQGQDRAQFLFITPGVFEVNKSYVKGARVKFFPEADHSIAVNYAKGWGEARSDLLKDKVFSVELENKFDDLKLHTEVGYDEDVFATLFQSTLKKEDYTLRLGLRDIDDEYSTITARPPDQGEIGGIVSADWSPGVWELSADMDLYQDRLFENPLNKDAFNLDFSLGAMRPLSKTWRWASAFYYVNTPQLISPRESVRIRNSLTRSFKALHNRSITAFVSHTYQMNRYDNSPSSEFDRHSLRTGFRLPLIRNLYYFLNYEYSWVEEVFDGSTMNPSVLETGVNYSQTFFKKFSSRFNLVYRDEQESEGNFSFLSGEDSIRGTLGLTYRPRHEMEIFADGSIRNSWTEDPESPAFHEGDIRVGVRMTWDLFFGWSPSGVIDGIVYNDLNGNGLYDANEKGIEGVIVNVGKRPVKTGSLGRFRTKVRAKKVKVDLDYDSVPKGYVLGTADQREFEIVNGGSYTANFGFTNRSSLNGVIFWDENNNGKPDWNDRLIPNVAVLLDGKKKAFTNYEGQYVFRDIMPGDHTIMIDVNSIPLEYLPKIKLRNSVFVEEGTIETFHVPLKRK